MNWRKYWKKGVCTFLIVTAEAHRVYDATHPRTRKQVPNSGPDEQLFVSKTKCLQPNFNTKVDLLDFGRAFRLVECSTESTRRRKTFEVAHVEVTLKIRNRSSLEPLRIDEPRGGTTAYASC